MAGGAREMLTAKAVQQDALLSRAFAGEGATRVQRQGPFDSHSSRKLESCSLRMTE